MILWNGGYNVYATNITKNLKSVNTKVVLEKRISSLAYLPRVPLTIIWCWCWYQILIQNYLLCKVALRKW